MTSMLEASSLASSSVWLTPTRSRKWMSSRLWHVAHTCWYTCASQRTKRGWVGGLVGGRGVPLSPRGVGGWVGGAARGSVPGPVRLLGWRCQGSGCAAAHSSLELCCSLTCPPAGGRANTALPKAECVFRTLPSSRHLTASLPKRRSFSGKLPPSRREAAPGSHA
jgi:hypothetical protein